MLRPVLFKIISTTQLKINFNEELSTSIALDNFKIESVSGAEPDLEILSIQIDKKSIFLNTRPHRSKAYYVIKLQDSSSSEFKGKSGTQLINDDLSRDIYFIGIEKVNQIRDDIFYKTPGIYNLEGSLVNSILSNHADNILSAQHAIGSLLNDNYISQNVIDEFRVRGPGSTDRLANENAYSIERISLLPTGSSLLNRTLEIDSTDIYPINLRQEFVESFGINQDTKNSSFSGFVISLPQKNIIKISYAKLIKSTDSEDCDGNIGTEYNLNKYKYSLLENRFDQVNSYKNSSLLSNQVLFSEFGNWTRPESGDTIIISYYYDNKSISIIESSIQVYEVINISNESIPSNSKYFSLKNGQIIDSFDQIPSLNGVVFKESENSSSTPAQFSKELIYNFSSLPSQIGEYSINYETGDVFLVGNSLGEGTGYNYFFADYKCKKIYKNNLDYSILGGELNLNYLRSVFGKNIKISFDYESVFAEETDYNPMCHKEVLGEDVENRVTSSFSLTTKNGPITDIFRIYNQTTGEIYSLDYFYNNDVYFTGNRLPSGTEVSSEFSNFIKKSGVELYASGAFITPVYYGAITSNLNNLNIEISPGLPAEFIDEITTSYVVRFLSQDIQDYSIINFYSPDSNGLIKGFSIPSGSVLPSIGSKIQIGTSAFIFNLPDNKIMNAENDGIGSTINSSLSLDSNFFKSEKFFRINSSELTPVTNNNSEYNYEINSNNLDILNKNLSKLRKFGDYTVDYVNGIVYVSINNLDNRFYGLGSYAISASTVQNKNIISVNKAYKKLSLYNDLPDKEYLSFNFSTSDITVNDIEGSTEVYDGAEIVSDSGQLIEPLIVNENYEVITNRPIASIKFIGLLKDLFGENLNSSLSSERYLESDSLSLIKKVSSGGKNLYLPEYVSFSYNIVDFKASSASKFKNLGSTYEIKFKTNDISSIFEIKNAVGTSILDQNLNFNLINNISVNSITSYSSSEYQITFDALDGSYSFNYGFDFILNGTDYWKINSYGPGYFIINKVSEVFGQNFSSEYFDLIIRPNISISDHTTLEYPASSFIDVDSITTIKYLTAYSPSPGTALAIDYSSGSIFFDYVYLNDKIIIYYEYGDNEIDWGINNSINEGQGYYVSYKYGALRSALRKNFGTLTSIPFFTNQSLSVDREIYRDALIGTLSAFPKGPTIPAISGLVNNIVKTNPDIKEMAFGSWILGRDYLNPGSVSYKGSLEFSDGKFGSGLKVKEDNSISIPSISNLSLREGTAEMWITPEWYGINNDADLTFLFSNVGSKKWNYVGGDPFSNKSGYNVVGSWIENDDRHGFDYSGGSLRIYKISGEQDGYTSNEYSSLFGIYKKNLNLTREIKNYETLEFLINYSYLLKSKSSYDALIASGFYKGFSIINDNGHNSFELNVIASTYKEYDLTKIFTITTEEYDLLSNFNPPYPTATCKCLFVSQNKTLENFDKLEIKISFDTFLNKSSVFSEPFWSDESIGSMMIMDNFGRTYEVTGLSDIIGKKQTSFIPDIISDIYISRYPINEPELSGKNYDSINDIDFSNFIIIKKQIRLELKNDQKSTNFFNSDYIWNFNWSKKTKVKYNIDPIDNVSWIGNEIFKNNFFYTDLKDSDLFSTIGDDISSSSIAIGVYGNSSVNIYKHLINVDYKFNLNDIYIGSVGSNPRSNEFTLNRLNSDIDCNGISSKIDTEQGIYIGYDHTCLSPINENIGQWLLKARFLKYSSLPYDVEIFENNYTNLTEYVFIDDPLVGSIKTNGAFSSITKGRRTISDNCVDSIDCSKYLRFLGNKLLDSDGWSLIQESDSEKINDIKDGREAESFIWRKIGEFDTQNSSGIYRINNLSSFESPETYFSNSSGLTTQNNCTKGNVNLTVSAKVNYFDTNTFSLSLEDNILSSGITIAEVNLLDYNLGITLTTDSYYNPMITLFDFSSSLSIESKNFDWLDGNFHEYQIIFDRDNSLVIVYVDNLIYIQKDIASLSLNSEDSCSKNLNGSFSIIFVDQRLIDSQDYFLSINSPIIDFNLIESSSNYNPGILKLEESDLFIVSGDLVNFELHPNSNEDDLVLIDGYISESDIDEIMITSDKDRFLLDTGISEDRSRFSIFKDGKGFLNFRIIDVDSKSPIIHNLATNIKHFSPGERHHIAASWKLNSEYEKDEMHLFLDGLEVPNLFRFGGQAPIKFNSKFSDISKENLWNYIEKKIVFPEFFSDGLITAGSNVISSSSLITDPSMVGRSILFGEETELYGKLLIILEAGTNWIAVGDPVSAEPYLFQLSYSNLNFRFVPYIDNILTDIKNESFSIYRTLCSGIESELSGIGYEISDGAIIIDNTVKSYNYRFNKTVKIIEFVEENSSCNWTDSISKNDIDIHIKTYGLKGRRFKEIISLAGTSIFSDEGFDPTESPNSRDGYSLIMTTGPKPKNLNDVSIRKYILYNHSVDIGSVIESGEIYNSVFEIDLSEYLVSSNYINNYKNNDGRYLEIIIDSDNINFGSYNELILYGWTPSGYSSEIITVNKNGSFFTSNRYLSLDKINGNFEIIDSDFDFISIINIVEKDSIFIQNGNSDYAEINRYSNGQFIIGKAEEIEYVPFELTPGYYLINYSANLRVNIPQVGERLFIGNDLTEASPLLASIDDFQILNSMLLDIRPWQPSSSGVRTITEDYYRENAACITNSTLALIDFEDPIEKQSRRLRNKKFLDADGNFSYNLSLDKREKLLSYINNEEEFVRYMMFLGYSIETAEETYYECNKAEGGPLYNLASYLPQYGNYFISPSSVNSSFGQSARFEEKSALTINNNNNILRNSGGTIEFWYQPKLDTFNDSDTRVLFESSSVIVDRFTSITPYLIRLNNSASKIISIRLLSNKKLSDSNYYSAAEKTSILFDEISIIESTGRYSNGTGTLKDFSMGAKLSFDGMDIVLSDSLPGEFTDVIVTYVPRQYSGEKISIYKDSYSRINSRIEIGDYSFIIPAEISWPENTWHRISLSYNFSNSNKFLKMFVDGKIYNTVYQYEKSDYPYVFEQEKIVTPSAITLTEQFSQIIVGNNLERRLSATGMIDNLRISRLPRSYPKDATGEEYDLNYSSNTENISPVKSDDLTTYIQDFDFDSLERNIFLANIIDSKNGIFDFDVLIRDDFNRVVGVGGGEIEDLLVDLISRIKPAHSNGYVKFINKKCKE